MAELPLPSRPRSGSCTSHSMPSTPASGNRRKRQAVGFTNRSRPSTAGSGGGGMRNEWGKQDGQCASGSGQGEMRVASRQDERPHTSSSTTRPRTSESSQRPHLQDFGSVRSSQRQPREDLYTRDPSVTVSTFSRSTMSGPTAVDKRLQRSVRDEVLKHRLNLGPVLRPHTVDGFITPGDLRAALAGVPQLKLSEEELDLCTSGTGPDNRIHVKDFIYNLKVPDYDDYDPWGQSRSREQFYLRNKASTAASRQFRRSPFDMPDKPIQPIKKKSESVSAPVESVGGPPTQPKQKHGAGIARRYLRQIADEMDMKGMSLLDVFRKIDVDASGAIDQEEFAQAVDVVGVPGLARAQMDFLFTHIDENENAKVDIHELQTALLDSQLDSAMSSTSGSRPSTFRPEATEFPWAQRTHGTRIGAILPVDHFNIRFRRSLAPPYATSDTVVPIKTTFAFNPDHLRYSTVTLANQWLTDGTGQGDIVKTRQEARIQRKREAEARIMTSVQNRDKAIYELDQTRVGGLSRTRASWMSNLKGAWA